MKICTKINKGNSINNDFPNLDFYIGFGLLKHDKTTINSEYNFYKITELGELILQKVRFEVDIDTKD